MQHLVDKPDLWSARSLIVSGVLATLPPTLYFLGTRPQPKSASLLYEAFFYLTLALLFLTANSLSSSIAISAAIRWACESWATFAKSYRTRFFGALALVAFAASLFEFATGSKVTHYFALSHPAALQVEQTHNIEAQVGRRESAA
jgi:hypothetical protein